MAEVECDSLQGKTQSPESGPESQSQLRAKADLKYFIGLSWYANKTYVVESDFLIALIKSLLAPTFQQISSF